MSSVSADSWEAPPSFSESSTPRVVVIGAEALAVHREAGLYPDPLHRLGREIRDSHVAAEAQDDTSVTQAREQLVRLARQLDGAVSPGAVLLTPALPSPPLSRATIDERAAKRLTRFLSPVNAAKLASAVVPVGVCGVQLIARDVRTLLAALDRL